MFTGASREVSGKAPSTPSSGPSPPGPRAGLETPRAPTFEGRLGVRSRPDSGKDWGRQAKTPYPLLTKVPPFTNRKKGRRESDRTETDTCRETESDRDTHRKRGSGVGRPCPNEGGHAPGVLTRVEEPTNVGSTGVAGPEEGRGTVGAPNETRPARRRAPAARARQGAKARPWRPRSGPPTDEGGPTASTLGRRPDPRSVVVCLVCLKKKR